MYTIHLSRVVMCRKVTLLFVLVLLLPGRSYYCAAAASFLISKQSNPAAVCSTTSATPNGKSKTTMAGGGVVIPGTEEGSCTNDSNNSSPPKRFYPIGTPGVAWTETEDAQWKAGTKLQRSYKEQVLDQIVAIGQDDAPSSWAIAEQYGALSHDPERYPLMAIRPKEWKANRPAVLVTGGVHGYETSGVQGALLFVREAAAAYADKVNLVVAPCVSPWAYEHIQRWQADLLDPNRSFTPDDPSRQTEESAALMAYLAKVLPPSGDGWTSHLDLHETTDTDATEFMPAKHAKNGLSSYAGETIPDGFYLVGDSLNPQLDFQQAVIDSVRKVTHIAPPDDKGNIIDEPVVKEGVIVVPVKELGLCCSVTGAPYVSTTEVYPDSPEVTDEDCNKAQVAAIQGALDYVLANV